MRINLRRAVPCVLAWLMLWSIAAMSADDLIPIRIGGQPTTTVTAQVSHVFMRTDILARNGLKGDVRLFAFGPAVNEALVSGAIDVGFIGDMPSVSLAAANAPTRVIARQSVFRGALMVTTKSNVKSVADLKGRQIYGPHGSSVYLMTLAMLEQAGLKAQDAQLVHMGFADLADAVNSGRIEAFFIWDPWVENFVDKGIARVLAQDVGLTMVTAMRDDFMKARPGAVERFLKAHKEALLFAAQNQDLVNGWYRENDAARALSMSVVQKATAYDPQWSAKAFGDVRMSFTDAELERYFGLARRAADLKIFPKLAPLSEHVDFAAAKRLDANAWAFDPKGVKFAK